MVAGGKWTGRALRRAAAGAVSVWLVASGAGVYWAATAGAAATGTPAALSATGRAGLIRAYAAFEGIPAADVGGIRPGSVHTAVTGRGVEWATAGFTPSAAAPRADQIRFQDGGAIGIFTRHGTAAWKMRRVGGEPFPCAGTVPSSVRQAWGLKIPSACQATGGRAAKLPGLRAGTTSTVASVALAQVGRGDTPASLQWTLDCNPYTALVGVAASTSGCGTDPNFHVLDRNEEWCADFSKWVWEQAGVTADLSVLTPSATSFATWGADRGQSLSFDSGTPAVGDAIVFYPKGTSTPVGSYADHVGLIVGVDSANNTVEMVNGDFMGSSNITVQNSGYVNIQSFANSIWGTGEKWVLVSSELSGASSSPLAVNGAGNDVAFINTSGQVSHDWGNSTGWHGPALIGGSARADSPVASDKAGTLVVFINTSGQVVNDWANTTGWHGPAAIGGTAEAGSPLVINAAGNDVAFINTSGQVVHDWGNSTGWHGPATIGGTARAGSAMTMDDGGDTVVFFNPSGQVENDWATAKGWKGPAPIGGTAAAGSGLATDDTGRDVIFTNASGQVVNDWGNSTGWHGPAAIGGTARPGSAIAQDGSGQDVVFFNTSGGVVNDWGNSTGWHGPAGIGGSARAGSGIAQSDTGQTVVYITSNGQVVNDWGNSTGWHGPAAIGGTSR
jgi:hypothetical protein